MPVEIRKADLLKVLPKSIAEEEKAIESDEAITGEEDFLDSLDGLLSKISSIMDTVDRIAKHPAVSAFLLQRFGIDVKKVTSQDVEEASEVASLIDKTIEKKRKGVG